MKRKWKGLLAAGLCLCLVMGVAACGKGEVKESAFQQALVAIENEDYETAYALLKKSKDRRAAEELEKFIFVPVSYTYKRATGNEGAYTFTYDERGNLLTDKVTDAYGGQVTEYTYSGDKMTSKRIQSKSGGWGYTYTYNDKGKLVLLRYLDRNGDWLGQTTYTYDQRGNCLSEECAKMEEAQDLTPLPEYTRYYTYDTEGRILSDRCTYYYEGEVEETVAEYYTYETDGSYCRQTKTDGQTFSGLPHTNLTYYDAAGKELRGERWIDGEADPYYTFEYRYNARGDVEYHHYYRRDDQERVTLRSYDEQGHLLEEETTTPEGEMTYLANNTYDQQGNRLTHEAVDVDANYWCKEICTYDAENRLLTQKYDYDGGWETTTYTYDAQGNKIKKERESKNGSCTTTYEYDDWGNVVCFFEYDIQGGAEYAYEKTVRWELQYYPKAVPEAVQNAIDNAAVE